MTEQWQELKETITEMRDNDGTGTQQEVCKFLANLMDLLEEQMQEPCEDAISRRAMLDGLASIAKAKAKSDAQKSLMGRVMFFTERLPSVKPQECDDAISRQAVIDCVTYYTPPSKIRNKIAELPSVTPEQRWIPVSELPRENGWYQCTVIVNDLPRTMELFYKNDKWLDNRRIDMFNTYDIYGYGYIEEKHKLSYQELISEFDWTKYVIAWMPLSEPYKAERSGEE